MKAGTLQRLLISHLRSYENIGRLVWKQSPVGSDPLVCPDKEGDGWGLIDARVKQTVSVSSTAVLQVEVPAGTEFQINMCLLPKAPEDKWTTNKFKLLVLTTI